MSALKQWFGRAGGASSSSTSSLKARKTTVSNPTIETVVQLVSEADPSFVITTYPYDKVAHLTLSQVRALIVHGPHVPSSENHLAPPQLLRSISASTDTASIASSRIGDVHGSDRMSRKSVEPVSLDRNESRSLNVTRDGRLGMRWRRRSSNAGLSSVSTAASSTVDGGAAGGYVLDAECFATGDSEVYLSYLFVDPKSGRVIPLLKEEKIFVRNLADQGGATAKIGVHLPQCVWNVIIEREVDSADEEEASFAFPLDGTDLVADIVKYFQVCWKGEAHEIISEKYDFTFGEYVRVDPKTTLQEFATFEAETFPTLTLHATGPTGTWILRASIDGNTSPEIRLRSIAKTIHSEQNHVDRNFGRTIHSILAIPRISLLSSKLVQMIAGDGDRNSFVSSTDNARVVVGVLGQLRRIAPLCDEVSGVFADLGKAMVNAHVQRISDWQTVQLESSVGTDDAVSLQQSGELFNLFVGAKRAGECLHRLRDLTGFSIDEVHSSERRKVVKDSVSLGLYFALATEAVETLGFAVDSLDEIAVLSRQMRMSLDGVLDTDTARPIKSIWQKFDEAQANMQAAFPAILEGGAFMKKGGAFVSKDVNEGRVFWGFGRLLEVEKTSTVVRALRQYIVRRCQSDPIFGSSSVAVKKMDAKSLLEVISDDGKWESDFERRFFIAIDRTRDGVVSVAQFRRWIFKHGGLFAAVEATIELANVENSSQMTDDIPPPTEMLKELEEWLEPVSFADELQQYLLRSELNESKEDSIRWVTDQIDKANNTSSRSEGAATRVLWLSMPTCSGKSTLSALLSHYHGDYDHRGTMSVAGHAYVGLGGRLKDLSKLAQTWAFQLAARDEEFRKQLYHVMIRQKSSEDPDEHEISDKGWVTAFQTLITDPFMMLKQIQLDEKADIEDGKSTKACMFVLDGFEEGKLSNRHRSSFLSLLKAESKYLPTHIKFLVTSNRHPSQKLLIEASNLPTGFVFPLVWDQFQQELDMQRYCFKILQKKLDGWPTLEVKHQKEGPIAELVTRADGNWLWLTFAAKILAHINDRAIATEHVLQIPQDLDGLIWHSFATSIHSWKTSSANYRTTSGNSSFLDRSFQLVSEQRSTVENGSSLQSLDDLLGLIKMAASSENPDVHELTRLIARIPTSSQLQQLQSPPSTPPQIVSTAATPGSRRRSTASSSIHIKNMRTITPPSPIVEVDNVPISANSDIAVLNSLELVDLEITQQVLWTIDVLQEPVPIKLLATLTRLTEDDVRKAIWCLNSTSFTVVDADTGTVKIAHSEFSMFMRDKERSGAYLPSSLHPTLISREQITFSLFEDQQRQHLVLAERCLEILKSKLFASRAEVSGMLEVPLELAYAIKHFLTHLTKCLTPNTGFSATYRAGIRQRRSNKWRTRQLKRMHRTQVILSAARAIASDTGSHAATAVVDEFSSIVKLYGIDDDELAVDSDPLKSGFLGISSYLFGEADEELWDYVEDEQSDDETYVRQVVDEDEHVESDTLLNIQGLPKTNTSLSLRALSVPGGENAHSAGFLTSRVLAQSGGSVVSLASSTSTSPPFPISGTATGTPRRSMGAAMSLFPTSSSPLIGLRALASASGNSPARTKFNGSPILPSMGRGTPAAQLVLPASVQQLYALYPSILLNLLDVFSTSKILRWLELIHIFANRNDGGPLKAIRSLQDLRRRWIPTDDEMCSIAGVIMTSTSGLDSSRGRNGRQTQESKLLNLAATPQHFRLLEELPTYRRAAALTRRLCYDSERALMELGPFLAKHPWEIYRWAQIFLPQGISLKQLMLRSNGQLPGEPPKEPNGIGIDVVRGARRGRWSAELRTLRGHTTAITAVATSPPNAARSISATGDELGVVRVWDLETGECVARLDARIAIAERDDSPYQSATRGLVIRSLIFPVDDPRKIVVAGDDGHVRIWSIDSAQLLHDMMPPVTNTPRKFGSSSDLQKPQPASDGPEHSGVIVFDNVDDFEVTFAPDELAEDVHDNEMDNAEDADSGHEYAEEIEELDFGVVCSESLSVGNKKMFVTGHRDGSAHIWDIQGRHVQALVGGARDADGIYHSGPILSMAVSKSYGETNDIATGSEDSSIVVWNTTTGKAMRKLGGHMGAVTALAFGHEFWRLVSGGSDGMIKIWDVGSGRCLQTMMAAGPSAPVPSNAKVDPENRYNVNTERGDSWISRIAFAPQNQIRHHPNLSQLVVTGTSDGVFRLWNIALGGQCLHVVKAHDGVMTGLAFVSSPPPAVAAKAMESATKIATEELKGHSGPEDEKIDGSDIESEEEDMNADLRSSARNIPGADDSQQQATVPETSPTEGLNFESAVLLTCGADGIAKLWQIQPRDVVVQAVSDEEGADDFEVDEDGVITTVLSFSTKRVYLYQCVHGFGGHFRGIRGMALTPDLRRLITAGGDHTAKVFDIETSRWSLALSKTAEEGWSAEAQIRSSQLDAREEAEAHKDLILCLAVEPALSNGDNTENTYFITGSTDGTAKVWNAKTAQLVSTLRGHTGWIRCISYAQPEPTKLIVLTGSTDGTARTFVVNTASKGEEKSNFLLEGHAGHVSSVALCGRGSQILALTGSLDGMSRLFDAGTGRLVNTFAAKDTLGTVLCSSFAGGSPVTHVVAGGGPKGALLAWSLDDPTKGLVFVGHEAPVSAVQAFSGTIVSGSNDGTTRVWNIATGDCIQVFSPSAAPVRFVDVNQSIIVVGSDDGFVRSYSLENSSTVPLAKLRGRVGRTPYAQDGQRQYVLRTDYQVWLWDPRTNRRTLAGYVADADAADFVVPIAVKGPHGLERLRLWWFKRGRPFVADASPQSLT